MIIDKIMKKILLILLLAITTASIFAQDSPSDYSLRFQEIIKSLKKLDYYDAIKQMNVFLELYPKSAATYYNRGFAKYKLNDFIGAREDMLKCKELGFTENQGFINRLTSKSYMVELLSKHYLDFNLLSPSNGYKQVFGRKDSLRGALRPERTCFDVTYYNLNVKVLPKSKSIEGSNQIFFKTTQTTNKIQIDLTSNFTISSIIWNGKELQYSRIDDAIFIQFGENLPANEKESLTIKYSGKPRIAPNPPWDAGFVWKKKRFKWWVGVSCEQLGASNWWPCKDHLSDKPDSMSINIHVPTGYQAIANGNLRSTHTIDNKYTNFEWFVSYPINSYGVTFYMGNFVNFNEKFKNSSGTYNADYYVLPHHLDIAKKYYSKTKDIVEAYEDLYGNYPYQNDGVGMVEAPFAGMEHQSAIAIGDGYGNDKRRTYENTDYDYLLVHETAHEWWGNTVTMADMADAWLSEGFATYSEYLFMEKKLGYKNYVDANAKNQLTIFNIWPIVGIKDVNDNSFISGDIYHKGAATLNNLRCTLNNDSLFFSIIKGYYNQFKFKTIATSDFTNYVNEKSGHDYTDFFNKFLYDTIPPVLEYNFGKVNDTLIFNYKWTGVGKNFTMPFSITINESKNYRIEATTEYQTFKIGGVSSFYLPNEKRLEKEQITKNAFTYYWTHWTL